MTRILIIVFNAPFHKDILAIISFHALALRNKPIDDVIRFLFQVNNDTIRAEFNECRCKIMSMDATNIFLMIMIIGAFLFSIYDGVILHFWKGKTVLSVPLRSRGKWDGYIFVGLIAMLFISNAFLRHGPTSTSVLLAILGILFFYICFIRKGRVIFKEHGFFYALLFFEYKKNGAH